MPEDNQVPFVASHGTAVAQGWMLVVVLFGALCLGVYRYFRFWAPPLYVEGEPDDEQVPSSDEA